MRLFATILLLVAAVSLVMIAVGAWKCMKATKGEGTDPFTKGTVEYKNFRKWAMILIVSLWGLVIGGLGYFLISLFL